MKRTRSARRQKSSRAARAADPNIDQVFQEFLAEQGERLKPEALSRYRDAIDLLRLHLNEYGDGLLSKAESSRLDKHRNAKGKERLEFCRLFGPGKIVASLEEFLRYFMVRKVAASEETTRAAGTVSKKLSKWLAEKGYVSEEESRDGVEVGGAAARDLPNAERAARVLCETFGESEMDPRDFDDRDYIDFDHCSIDRIEPGKLWLEPFLDEEERVLGPVPVPEAATKLLKEGWEISCALARVQGEWRIVEVANVYPR